jgi:hypothetical protein
MPSRYEYERAIRRSGLPPLSRLLALTIATWADPDTGRIPPQHQPAQSVLLEATGLAKGTFLTHRATLVERGWLRYDSPTSEQARRDHAQNVYFILLPAGSAADLAKADIADASTDSEARSGADLGQELTQPRSAVDLAKTGQTPTTEARSAPDPGQELTTRVPYVVSSKDSLDRFEEFWSAYPRKIAKPNGRKAWLAAMKRKADPDAVIAAATAHATAWRVAGTEKQWIPHPSTWLNGERYADDASDLPAALPAAPAQRPLWRDPSERGTF